MAKETSFFEIVVNNPNIKTLNDLLVLYKENGIDLSTTTPEEFLSFSNDSGVTNNDIIFDDYHSFVLHDNSYKNPGDYEILTGMVFYVPKILKQVKDPNIKGINTFFLNTNFFKSETLKKIEKDKGYSLTLNSKSEGYYGQLKKTIPKVKVFIWSRALSKTLDSENNGKLIDVSKFIIGLETGISKSGGSFSFSLPSLLCEKNSFNGWEVKSNSLFEYKDSEEYLAKSSLFEISDGNEDKGTDFSKRSSFLFENILQNNDLVFIRFEKLDLEKEDSLVLNNNSIPGNIYDMIGLIDKNKTSINFQGNNASINIAGRDLMKLLIDDGSYFFPSQFAANLFPGTKSEQFLQRTIEGKKHPLNIYNTSTVSEILQFIIEKLSSIEIVPDYLFQGYKNNRGFSTDQDIKEKQPNINETYSKTLDLMKKSIVKNIDSLKSFLNKEEYLRIRNNPYLNQEDTNKIFNSLYSMMNKAYNDGVLDPDNNVTNYGYKYPLEYNGKIYGIPGNSSLEGGYKKNEDVQFSNIERVLPLLDVENIFYDSFILPEISVKPEGNIVEDVPKKKIDFDIYVDKITSILKGISFMVSSQYKYKKEITQGQSKHKKGIWQITNLLIDDSIKHRQLIDSSLSSMDGSLFNFFKKVCQEPFVEFFGDTYGDQYYWTVRKMPFDKKSILAAIYGDEDNPKPYIYEIEPIDLIEENLEYTDDKDIFTWFHFVPKLNIFSNKQDYSLFLFPPKVFDEYVKIWGNKPLQIVNNYLPYDLTLKSGREFNSIGSIEKIAFEDLRYIIESNIYMPFTRKGVIVIKGDRRVKIGNYIRHKSTGEIFYVDSVSQRFSSTKTGPERITIIQVSRGMVEKYLKEVEEPGYNSKISYFNIVPFKENFFNQYVEEKDVTWVVKDFKALSKISANSSRTYNNYDDYIEYAKSYIRKVENNNRPFKIPTYKYGDWMVGYSKVIDPFKDKRFTEYFNFLPNDVVVANGKIIPDSLIERLLDDDVKTRINSIQNVFGNYLGPTEVTALTSTLYNAGISYNTKNSKVDKFKTFRILVKDYISKTNNETRSLLEKYYKNFLNSSTKGKVSLSSRRLSEVDLFFENFDLYKTKDPVKEEDINITKTSKSKVINKEKLYSDIKINTEVFNFFLRRQNK